MNNVTFDMDANFTIEGFLTSLNNEIFEPRENLGNFNNGQISDGLWELCITDTSPGNVGFINNWNIVLDENNNLPDVGFIEFPVCNTNCTVGCQCQDSTSNNCLLLPDIIISDTVMLNDFHEYPDTIRVTSATSNIGYGTLEFRGTNEWFCDDIQVPVGTICNDGSYPKQKVNQRIYKKVEQDCIDWVDVVAGYMQYHAAEGHEHPHIDSWVHNSIRIKGRDESNPLSWPLISAGSKVSFCAENSVLCNNNFQDYCSYQGEEYNVDDNNFDGTLVDGNLVNGRMGQFYTCNALIQGVSVGYSDVYGYLLNGQEILFNGNTCNGKYYVVSHFDPDSLFTEVTRENNVSYIPINLSKQQSNCCITNFEAIDVDATGCEMEFNDLTQPEANDWFWEFGDGSTSTDQFPVHCFDTIGTYQVSLTTTNDSSCTNTYTKSVTANCDCSFISDIANFNNFDIKISPNPFEKYTTINLNLNNSSKVKIDVFNLLNQKVKTIQPLITLQNGTKNYLLELDEKIFFIFIYYLLIANFLELILLSAIKLTI